MNKDVFVDRLFPALRNANTTDRYPIDLYIYGPGLSSEINLQRKILIQEKNWRLNGEVVYNPDTEPERFDSLVPGDIAVLEFNNGVVPDTVRIVFVGTAVPQDAALHIQLTNLLGTAKMLEVTPADLERSIQQSGIVMNHPLRGLILTTDLESVVLGSEQAVESILAVPARPRISVESLQRARESASRIGSFGEQLVNDYFQQLQNEGHILSYEWVSQTDAISPYDFWYSTDGQNRILIDVKTTSSTFERPIHISSPELRIMARGTERYDIYRVYETTERTGKLRIATDVRLFAAQILTVLNGLPEGIAADGISFDPSRLPMGTDDPVTLNLIEPNDD